MRRIALLLFLFAGSAGAQTFTWDSGGELVISAPGTNELRVIENPEIADDLPAYAIRGEVKYEGVTGTAYLELWNHFPGTNYFTRTLANLGLLKKMEGSHA